MKEPAYQKAPSKVKGLGKFDRGEDLNHMLFVAVLNGVGCVATNNM
jgi:hypothetical protein